MVLEVCKWIKQRTKLYPAVLITLWEFGTMPKHKENYTFNLDDVKIPALNYRPDRYKSQLKNPSDVWKISLVSGNSQERTDHPAQYPEELIERIIKTGTKPGDLVLDPFMGSGTTAVCAQNLDRSFVGYETEIDFIKIAKQRLDNGKK